MLMFSLEGLAIDRIDYRAIEDEVGNDRLGHRPAETVRFPDCESKRCCGLVTAARNLVKKSPNPLVGVNIIVDKVDDIADRCVSKFRSDDLPCVPQRRLADAL